jgi:hypothetical protein
LSNLFFEKQGIQFDKLCKELTNYLIDVKKVPIGDILRTCLKHDHFLTPADRVNKMLDMLRNEKLERKNENDSLTDFFIKEIDFAKNNINQRTLYKSEHKQLLKRIEKQQNK